MARRAPRGRGCQRRHCLSRWRLLTATATDGRLANSAICGGGRRPSVDAAAELDILVAVWRGHSALPAPLHKFALVAAEHVAAKPAAVLDAQLAPIRARATNRALVAAEHVAAKPFDTVGTVSSDAQLRLMTPAEFEAHVRAHCRFLLMPIITADALHEVAENKNLAGYQAAWLPEQLTGLLTKVRADDGVLVIGDYLGRGHAMGTAAIIHLRTDDLLTE